MFAHPLFNRAVTMTICEYCGRAHRATEIDDRFCSVVCRTQYHESPHAYQPDELLEEQRHQGYLLRMYLITLLKSAGQLLRQAEHLSSEQQLSNQREWMTNIAAQESQMLKLSSIFEAPAPPPTPPAPADGLAE
jgi:hypothetical protein